MPRSAIPATGLARRCSCLNSVSPVVNTYYVSQIITSASGIGGFRASPLAARAIKAAAPPAPGNRLHRIACQLIDKENLDHGRVRRPQRMIRQSGRFGDKIMRSLTDERATGRKTV